MSSAYEILITRSAQKQLNKLPEEVAEELIEVIASLANDPRPIGCKKLKGRNGYRVRKGNYRILYDIFDKQLLIEVIALGHRKDIYD